MENKRLHSIRIAPENWIYADRFGRLFELLDKYPCDIGDIALFTACIHSPMKLGELERLMSIIKERLDAIRKAGFSAGINHLTTIGHHCEDLDAGLGDAYTYMTNIDGEVCRGSYCMRDASYIREYVIPCYTAMANAHPDFIWIDDDIRYGHMPIGNGCFCDGCIASFNEKFGHSFTREALRDALNENDTALRMEWLEHSGDAICELFDAIAETVYSADPHIKLGFMTGERFFEGYRFDRYANALSQSGKHRIMWRPGGGAYTDTSFELIMIKQEQVGRQNAYLPDYVDVIQYEVENFPYQLLKKTPRSTALETAMCMSVGCTGAAFNILPSETMEPIDTIIPHLRAIDGMKEFYRAESELLSGLKPAGIHTGWSADLQATVPEGEFFTAPTSRLASYAREMFFFGLPQCYNKSFANITMLDGQSAAVMSDGEIREILSGGVYLSASALKHLTDRGFGELTGFSAGKEIPVDARERYTEHALNAGIVGGIRNCRQAFNSGESYALVPEKEDCEVLAELVDYHDRKLCSCACGIYENKLGGRACAAGYYPFSWVSDIQKTVQLKRILLWLSNGSLPSYVDSYHRVMNNTFIGGGRVCSVLFNAANDELTDVVLALRSDSDTAMQYTMFDGKRELCAERTEKHGDGTYRYFRIQSIKPYEGVIIDA